MSRILSVGGCWGDFFGTEQVFILGNSILQSLYTQCPRQQAILVPNMTDHCSAGRMVAIVLYA